jgi:copper resistance protein D
MTPHLRAALITLAIAVALTLFCCPLKPAQTPPSQPQESAGGASGHHAMAMGDMQHDHTMPMPGTAPASPVSGTEWSVFNHRGAGWFIFFWGLTALIAGLEWPQRTWLRFVPPLMLLGLVEFLFLRNDPEAWPVGPIGFWPSLKEPDVFQHRIFLLLLLVIAIVELLRAADRLPPLLHKFALPGLAVFGGIYLFFHKHGGLEMEQMMQHMSDPAMASSQAMRSMMASMHWIKHEHLWFSICGFGLAAAKLLADTGRLRGRVGATLWSVFAVLLGIYMMGYTE